MSNYLETCLEIIKNLKDYFKYRCTHCKSHGIKKILIRENEVLYLYKCHDCKLFSLELDKSISLRKIITSSSLEMRIILHEDYDINITDEEYSRFDSWVENS
ncbi:hypothetical protein [Candidatus Deianiraea vastatrix]|uniref:Uncharacterized protein n=1 Tax=Candidatus Deianiraea vastatrix TaxID=2163644 RepID=A0A5B8XCF5_9RICK|nr:hypothetical protein [Candidatus Deianiraea vastatrix]QED23029.1 hypothetical protein Deia_00221 [Candidatus Deianiraea vastatrix]